MKQRLVNFIRNNRKKTLIICSFLIVIIGACLVIVNTFAALKPVRSVTISSEKTNYGSSEPGSWNIEKSAEWTGKGKARITFNLDTIIKKNTDNSDIVLVLDRSGSMIGDKLSKVKADAKDLVEKKLSSGNNRFALINFDTDSELMVGLTNNKQELINKIDSLVAIGTTNYYKALVNVDAALKGYVKDPERDLVLLFLTDGFPNEDTPNEEGFYKYLKSQYPYLTVNGIQYEMGSDVLEPLKKISDYQYIAHMDNLNNVLFDAAESPISYEEFTIVDYIDDTYFILDSVDKISVSAGTVKLEYEGNTPKVTWSMGNGALKSGQSAIMTIDVILKDEYMGTEGMYPTNKKEEIITSLPDTPSEDIDTPKTPVLSEAYQVIYDGNAPQGCTISPVPATKKYAAYDTVKIDETPMTCGNYQFQGWEILTEGVKKVNDDYFIMPEQDVNLRGVWTQLSITKSMNGSVSKVQTIYKIMVDNAEDDDKSSQFVAGSSGIDFQYCPLDQSGNSINGQGVYKLSSTKNDKRPIYYYRGNVNNNYVVYANTCWKILRTTDTGGAKLLYNGPVDASGKCTNTNNYSIGMSSFNSEHNSLADAGYMYGTVYQNKVLGKTETVLIPFELQPSYYYASDVVAKDWNDGNGLVYTLVNEFTVTEAQYPSIIGKYMSWYHTNADPNAGILQVIDAPLYVAGYQIIDGNYVAYGVQVENGKKQEDYQFAAGSGITKNANGTFTINNSKIITGIDWYNNFASYKNWYTCGDKTTTCAEPKKITYTTVDGYDYIPYGDFKYGASFTYSGGQYTLTNTEQFYDWSSNKTKVNTHHYTCLNSSGVCSKVYYIYQDIVDATDGTEGIFYIELTGGKSIEDARREMETNSNNSAVKTLIDTWYESHIKGTVYESMLEDTVYCNSRDDNKLGTDQQYINNGLIPSTGNINYALHFSSFGRAFATSKPSVKCTNANDSFTVNTKNGNGALTYPIAMMTIDEAELAGRCRGTYVDISGENPYWLMAPINMDGTFVAGAGILNGTTYLVPMSNPLHVRPVVSIKPGTRVIGGTGTKTDPYLLDSNQ